MATSLRIPDESLNGLGLLIEHADVLAGFGSCGLDHEAPHTFAKQLAATSNLPVKSAREIVGNVMGLLELRASTDQTADALYDDLTEAINESTPAEWRATYLQKWTTSRRHIVEALRDDSPLDVLRKVVALSQEHGNLYSSAKVVVDARPVMKRSGDEVISWLLSSTLVLRSECRKGRDETSYYSLDAGDIEKLRDECNRALLKLGVASESLKKTGGQTITVRNEQ